MVGPGSDMNRGVGRRITTAVGSTTTTRGPGVRAVNSTESAVGGGPPWLRLHSISLSETTSAGIPYRITSAIRIRVTIAATTIVDQAIVELSTGDAIGITTTIGRGVA